MPPTDTLARAKAWIESQLNNFPHGDSTEHDTALIGDLLPIASDAVELLEAESDFTQWFDEVALDHIPSEVFQTEGRALRDRMSDSGLGMLANIEQALPEMDVAVDAPCANCRYDYGFHGPRGVPYHCSGFTPEAGPAE